MVVGSDWVAVSCPRRPERANEHRQARARRRGPPRHGLVEREDAVVEDDDAGRTGVLADRLRRRRGLADGQVVLQRRAIHATDPARLPGVDLQRSTSAPVELSSTIAWIWTVGAVAGYLASEARTPPLAAPASAGCEGEFLAAQRRPAALDGEHAAVALLRGERRGRRGSGVRTKVDSAHQDSWCRQRTAIRSRMNSYRRAPFSARGQRRPGPRRVLGGLHPHQLRRDVEAAARCPARLRAPGCPAAPAAPRSRGKRCPRPAPAPPSPAGC